MLQRPFHVLLVEDNAAHARLATMAILNDSASVTVDRVIDGEEALSYLQRQPPYENRPDVHLILLDLKAPRIDGVEVLRRIKEHPEFRMIPVVVLSASLSPKEVAGAYRNHANSFLVKPLDFEQFQRMISDLLSYWGTWNQSS